jgi:hypothetical protein
VEEGGGVLSAPLPLPIAASAISRASAVARVLAASEAVGPDPIAAPAAIPTASMVAARIALAL